MAWRLACEWASTGHRVFLYTTPGGTPDAVPPGIDVAELPGAAGRYSRRWFAATADVDLVDVDVVVGVSAGARRILGRSDVAAPVLMQAHGTSADEIRTKWSLRTPRALLGIVRNVVGLVQDVRNYRRYTAVVSIGPSVTDSIATYPRWAQPRRVTTISNGIPRSTTVSAGSSRSGLLYVGRLHREKGVDRLIRSMSEGDTDLEVVGDGPERAHLEHLVGELGLSGRVTFHGALPAPDVRDVTAAAAVVVVPSRRREGLPLVVLEALDSGAQVVVSPTVRAALAAVAPAGVLTWDPDGETLASVLSAASEQSDRVVLPEEYDIRTVAERYVTLFDEINGQRSHGH